MRKKTLISTPISQFGIGILSCFMLADRMEIRTHAGGAQQTDLIVSGPGSLFWTRAGTRAEQGTEVKLWLKPEIVPSHDSAKMLQVLRVDSGREDGGFDPFLELARHTVWPKYPVKVSPPDARTDRFR